MLNHYGDYRDVDSASWERFELNMIEHTTHQLNQARIDYALSIELGARVACAIVAESIK